MSYLCHRVCLIKDEELERRAWIAVDRLPHRCRRKSFDLLPHHIDAALITGIQLSHSRLLQTGPVPQVCMHPHVHMRQVHPDLIVQGHDLNSPKKLPGNRKGRGSLSSARRAIKQKVGQLSQQLIACSVLVWGWQQTSIAPP